MKPGIGRHALVASVRMFRIGRVIGPVTRIGHGSSMVVVVVIGCLGE
jgi:hypothetical protein